MEKIWLQKHELSKIIIYEKIDLIKPENNQELLNDLQDRTGIKTIKRVEIGKIDFLKDTCTLQIFYDVSGPLVNTIGLNDNNKNGRDDDDDD
jgi:hypothetical protein